MGYRKDRGGAEVNSSSMADIAFLLLVFFLVTTTIPNDKGLMMQLPQKQQDESIDFVINERNLFKVNINSEDRLLVEDEVMTDVKQLKARAKEFILNPARNPDLAETPQKAIVSLKNNRGTSYEMFISVLDQLQGAYYEIWAERVGLTAHQYRNLDRKNPDELELYERGKEGLPMAISIAQPTKER